jgi:perosamine synthetase
MKLIIYDILQTIRQLQSGGAVALHQPDLTGNEVQYTQDAIKSGCVSAEEGYVDLFEDKLTSLTCAAKSVAVVNGTCGLHLALHLLGVDQNSEVLTPALNFVGTANAITQAGAIPHFIDSSVHDMTVCPEKLEKYLETIADFQVNKIVNKKTGRKISALIVAHLLGSSANMQKLEKVAQRYQIKLIEDATGALGSLYEGKHLGLHSDLAVFSFNGNKIVTTGAGGALISRDKSLMERAMHLSTTAKSSAEGIYFHDAIGFNFRMANINSAIGVAQLENLSNFLKQKQKLSEYYRQAFSSHESIQFIKPTPGANCWLSAIQIQDATSVKLKEFVDVAQKQEIMLRPLWILNNQLPMYLDCPSMDLENAKHWANTVLCLPSSAYLGAVL